MPVLILERIAAIILVIACALSAIAVFLNLDIRESQNLPSGDKRELSQFQEFLQAIDTRNLTPEQFADKWGAYLEMSREEAIAYYKRSLRYFGQL